LARSNTRPDRLQAIRVRIVNARVDPAVVAVVKVLHDRKLVSCEHVLEMLRDISDEHPELRFRDFVIALHIAVLGNQPGGTIQ
jgi:hypothetical protein